MDSIFEIAFDAWCRGCSDDIEEGDTVGFIPGEKGVHCLYCVIEDYLFDKDDND